MKGGVVPPAVVEHLAQHPLAVVDVGAARGVPPHWRPFLEVMRAHAFEPNEAECARLAANSHPNITWHPKALAGESGPRSLYVLATPTGSSLFPIDPDFSAMYGVPSYHRIVEEVEVECSTLSDVLDGAGAGPALLKLDTQGSELEILSGLSVEQMAGVIAVEVEAEFHEAYTGQPVFADVHQFMVDRGFELFDLRTQRIYLSDGKREAHFLKEYLDTAVGTRHLSARLHAADALYIRPIANSVGSLSAIDFVLYLTIFQIYRYYDVIFWMLEQPHAVEVFGEQGRFELQSWYRAVAPRPRYLQRVGPIPRALRRSIRGLSFAVEKVCGEGFNPPRTFWTHSFWPDQ